ICPRSRWYEVAMAPPMAADALDRPSFTIADLLAELSFPSAVSHGLVEAVGGVRSPIAHDGDSVDLARALGPDLVSLVAAAGPGAAGLFQRELDAHAGALVAVVGGRHRP